MAHREVIASPEFTAMRIELELSAMRLDEILVGLDVSIAHHPTRYPKVRGTKPPVHTVITEEVPEAGVPSYLIWFTFTSKQVTLEGIEYAFPSEVNQVPRNLQRT